MGSVIAGCHCDSKVLLNKCEVSQRKYLIVITGCRIEDELVILTVTERYLERNLELIAIRREETRDITITSQLVVSHHRMILQVTQGKPNCLKRI